jgi:hypothetical protein
MELELDDKRQYLTSYNEYPTVLEFNNSNNHALPQKQIIEPYVVAANKKSDYEAKDNKSYLSKSPLGITFGLIFGLLIILCGFFSEEIFEYPEFITRIIILFIIILFLSLALITLGMSTENATKKNIFNCDSNSVTPLSKLKIEPNLLEALGVPINSAICSGDTLNDISISKSNVIFIGISMTLSFILFILFFIGLLKKNEPLEFLFKSMTKYIIVLILVFIMSALMVSFKSAIYVNNKRNKCDNLTSFNERVNNMHISNNDKNNLENKLKENNFIMDSLICINDLDTYMYEDGYILKENKQTNNSFDGLLFFSYIVILSLLIAFVIGIIINKSELKHINMIFIWIMSIFCLAAIIYPWALNQNPLNHKKVNLITGLVSTILPSILFALLSIIKYLFG